MYVYIHIYMCVCMCVCIYIDPMYFSVLHIIKQFFKRLLNHQPLNFKSQASNEAISH